MLCKILFLFFGFFYFLFIIVIIIIFSLCNSSITIGIWLCVGGCVHHVSLSKNVPPAHVLVVRVWVRKGFDRVGLYLSVGLNLDQV